MAKVLVSPAKLLSEAKNACGDMAVEASAAGRHEASREWLALAIECDRVLRDAVRVAANG